MGSRSYEQQGCVPAKSLSVVLVGTGSGEARAIEAGLARLGKARLMEYRQPKDIIGNMPANGVDLAVISVDTPSVSLKPILQWVRMHWPACLPVVVAPPQAEGAEQAARENAALFFHTPVTEQHWMAVLEGVTRCRQAARTSA